MSCGQGAWLAVWAELGVTEYFGVDGTYVDQNALAIPRRLSTSGDLPGTTTALPADPLRKRQIFLNSAKDAERDVLGAYRPAIGARSAR